MELKVGKLKVAEILEGGKLKVVYDCSSSTEEGEIEYIVDLNTNAQVVVSRDTAYEYDYNMYTSRIRKNFESYSPYVNIAFMFETDKAFEIKLKPKPPKKMTIKDIEKQLGCKIEIVSE